jgi:hypothetical protein
MYIVVRCDDSDIGGVRASQLRGDADLSSDDNVQLLIDSFDVRRSAFVFATNPNGALWDAQFSGVDELNESWSGIWDVAVSRLEYDFNTRRRLLAFAQYDNESERVDFNVRFHWVPVIGDDVFMVRNSGYTTEPLARFRFPEIQALSRPLNGAFVINVVHRLTP